MQRFQITQGTSRRWHSPPSGGEYLHCCPSASSWLLPWLSVGAWGKTPAVIPSALIGRPVPEFNLPPVQGRELGLSSADLKGEVSLVNVFASWCTACRDEHPVFMELRRANAVPIHGINYKDRPSDAERWLNTLGDPYTRTGVDRNGRVAIDWGVYGVPETFVIDAEGRIALKLVGAVTPEVYRETIRPLIEKLR
jgi:cytochrome c biogenesis protein CcmG, thiol:disulfide interchange protein DsbE